MIVHDKFVIASSTKSGTHSCMSLARATEGMEYIRTNHMMVVPEEHAHKDRLFLVRNPYDRMMSIYHHIVRKYTEWGYRYIKDMDFVEFIPWFLDQRLALLEHPKTDSYGAPGVWIRTAKENWDEFISDSHLERSEGVPCHWFKMEEASEDFFPWLVGMYRLKTRREDMPRSNSADKFLARERLDRKWDSIPDDLKRRVSREWSEADCVFFKYSKEVPHTL